MEPNMTLEQAYDLLEEGIMTAVRAKIRQKIEAAKKQIKLEAAKR